MTRCARTPRHHTSRATDTMQALSMVLLRQSGPPATRYTPRPFAGLKLTGLPTNRDNPVVKLLAQPGRLYALTACGELYASEVWGRYLRSLERRRGPVTVRFTRVMTHRIIDVAAHADELLLVTRAGRVSTMVVDDPAAPVRQPVTVEPPPTGRVIQVATCARRSYLITQDGALYERQIDTSHSFHRVPGFGATATRAACHVVTGYWTTTVLTTTGATYLRTGDSSDWRRLAAPPFVYPLLKGVPVVGHTEDGVLHIVEIPDAEAWTVVPPAPVVNAFPGADLLVLGEDGGFYQGDRQGDDTVVWTRRALPEPLLLFQPETGLFRIGLGESGTLYSLE